MLLKSTLVAAGLVMSAATAASAQAFFVGPGPYYGPGYYGPPVYAAPAPVVVAPPAYYGGWGPRYGAWGPRPGPYYNVGVVTGPGWW